VLGWQGARSHGGRIKVARCGDRFPHAGKKQGPSCIWYGNIADGSCWPAGETRGHFGWIARASAVPGIRKLFSWCRLQEPKGAAAGSALWWGRFHRQRRGPGQIFDNRNIRERRGNEKSDTRGGFSVCSHSAFGAIYPIRKKKQRLSQALGGYQEDVGARHYEMRHRRQECLFGGLPRRHGSCERAKNKGGRNLRNKGKTISVRSENDAACEYRRGIATCAPPSPWAIAECLPGSDPPRAGSARSTIRPRSAPDPAAAL